KSREGSRRTPFYPRRATKNTFFIREVTRRIAKNTSLSTKGHWDFSLRECGRQPHFAAANRVQPIVNEPQ
ncbi:MAG: hypothetical protein OXJ55_09180, partial [Caldilineaceae bacterium]|nr:hypothetical protein [Caldilineaceae bacterium]